MVDVSILWLITSFMVLTNFGHALGVFLNRGLGSHRWSSQHEHSCLVHRFLLGEFEEIDKILQFLDSLETNVIEAITIRFLEEWSVHTQSVTMTSTSRSSRRRHHQHKSRSSIPNSQSIAQTTLWSPLVWRFWLTSYGWCNYGVFAILQHFYWFFGLWPHLCCRLPSFNNIWKI